MDQDNIRILHRLELFTSPTPLIDLILGRKATLATTLTNLKTQRVTITNCLRARAGQLNCHKLQVSELRTLHKLSTRDEWYDSLVKAYKSPLFRRKDSVEKVLHQFADGNRCLFPELRRFDKKRQNIKKERA
ncbi:hypothetical protein E6O75_ATG00329 [Venturia nashicola]|uniref:Uncharacterized protein n=1 Tax=Venturia nashicola TaxID=86259 RepID=A0A4Z1PWJ8_9PEZI|nr:hypothetical protein E6O75_ATG00329 [Venturia nashicola]